MRGSDIGLIFHCQPCSFPAYRQADRVISGFILCLPFRRAEPKYRTDLQDPGRLGSIHSRHPLRVIHSVGDSIIDELRHRTQLEAIGIAFGGSVIITLIYALLVQVGVPQVSCMFVPLLMLLLWVIGYLWTMWICR